ncbi:hypothetical protein AB5J72_17315 [Streptomyces sp. CG1]|uniref:hypothetical protein n=1 Tax=Streptomyces sp. CG1 TaxID=1287523 RepID=UPI0034E25CDD
MTGAEAEWPLDGPELAGEDFGLWVRGVDYMAGWREAREAADEVNLAFLGSGFEPSELRAVAATNDDGRGVVRLVGQPGAVIRLAGLLWRSANGGGGAA